MGEWMVWDVQKKYREEKVYTEKKGKEGVVGPIQ